jgi:peptidoglycan DL-endopeptidase CwlO
VRAEVTPPRRHRWQSSAGFALLATLMSGLVLPAAGVLAAQPATADPRYPDIRQLQQANSAATAKAAAVTRLQTALTAGSARLAATQLAAEQAAEAYDAAQITLDQRTEGALRAGSNAASAQGAFQQSRAAVGRLAAQAYRDGGEPSLAEAMFASQGLQDLLDRSAVLGILGGERVATMRQLDTSRNFASWMQQQADQAVQQQQDAMTVLDGARQQAAQAAAGAAAALAATRTQQRTLLVELATLTRTVADLQRQREAGLAADAAARQAAAQQAASGQSSELGPTPAGPDAPGATGPADATAAAGQAAVAWARRQVGLPYRWGGAGPDSYDCSGLTMRAWQQAAVSLPHYAASQYAQSAHLPYGAMRPGDLIFYATDTHAPSTIHHVTMYLGGGMMIEAPYTGADVRIVPIRWDGAMPQAARP